MNPAAPAYRKLPGRALAFSGIGRLWLADDHLLEVESLLFHERYRRFFLKDIAAIVIRRTKVRLYWNLAHGILGLVGGAVCGALLYFGNQDTRMFMYIFAGMIAPFAFVFLLLFLINSLLGPTCRCHLQTTSSGWHPLAAPSRLRKARRVLAQLAPLIEAAQSARISAPPASATEPLHQP